MSKDEFKNDCRKACASILKGAIRDPKAYLGDPLEIEEAGDVIRVYMTLGGPTVWASFNRRTETGKVFYHHGATLTYKRFGREAYMKLIEFVY